MKLKIAFWVSVVVALALYLVSVLWSIPQIATSAGGLPPFDMQPMGYGLEAAQSFLRALPETGRDFYLSTQHLLDTAFPAALGLMFVLGFSLLFHGWFRWVLFAVTIGAVGFDYLENAAVSSLLLAGADGVTAELVSTASRWTILKSVCTSLCYLALVGGGIRALLANWSRKTS